MQNFADVMQQCLKILKVPLFCCRGYLWTLGFCGYVAQISRCSTSWTNSNLSAICQVFDIVCSVMPPLKLEEREIFHLSALLLQICCCMPCGALCYFSGKELDYQQVLRGQPIESNSQGPLIFRNYSLMEINWGKKIA